MERTSRFMARQTDSSSSTIAISGLDLLKGNVLRALSVARRSIWLSWYQSRGVRGVCILDFGPIGEGGRNGILEYWNGGIMERLVAEAVRSGFQYSIIPIFQSAPFHHFICPCRFSCSSVVHRSFARCAPVQPPNPPASYPSPARGGLLRFFPRCPARRQFACSTIP